MDTGFGKEAPLITHPVHAWRGWVTVGGVSQKSWGSRARWSQVTWFEARITFPRPAQA